MPGGRQNFGNFRFGFRERSGLLAEISFGHCCVSNPRARQAHDDSAVETPPAVARRALSGEAALDRRARSHSLSRRLSNCLPKLRKRHHSLETRIMEKQE